jgi:2-phospho-L-lactate guanylyltransferase
MEPKMLMTLFIAIPVKNLLESKTRLSSILTLDKRQELVRRMLVDVLKAVTSSELVSRVIVVCSDRTVLKDSTYPKITIIGEELDRGLNPALGGAVDYCMHHGADSLLIIPADIPLIQKSDVEVIIHSSSDRGIVIVPSKDHFGTNALMLTPPNVIPTAFGPNSFLSHLNLAEGHGTAVNVVQVERISLDIDTVEDIREFISFRTNTNTRGFFFEIGIVELLGKS